MLLRILCQHGKKTITYQRCARFSSTSSSVSSASFQNELFKVKTFLEENPETMESINDKFARPYADVQSLIDNNFLSYLEESDSSLFDFYRNGFILPPAIDINYIMSHTKEVEQNIKNRKTEFVDVFEVISAYKRLIKIDLELETQQKNLESCKNVEHAAATNFVIFLLSLLRQTIEKFYLTRALSIPNKTKPDALVKESKTKQVIETIGKKPSFDFEVADHILIAKRFKGLRQKERAGMMEKRNYFLIGGLAELEQALVHYTIDKLKTHGFTFLSVPNILQEAVFEGAGLANKKMDIMVFNIQNTAEPNFALAGTSELGLCAYFAQHAVSIKDLPRKVCSVSTCYRRETGTRLDKYGLFRVKQFLKVEMFGVTANETGEESGKLFLEFVGIQKEIFKELGLHFNVVSMPSYELGLPAYQKIDVEAWFPGRNKYDEISSASNCTDFQSRRLHILYKDNQNYRFAHTVNATACAVPRMIIALLENGQQWNHEVVLPTCLHRYMNGKTKLRKEFFVTPEYFGVGSRISKRKFIQNSLKEAEDSHHN